ncbi:MAG: aldo/keto reductase [Melioribacteraceae bacterium]|nr:aldo/keto reductase [Melioribacteraceae bacterium]
MNYRKFGSTELTVSEIGFGAWAIGGPAMAGDIPIGWGDVDDETSVKALNKSFDLGINFFDTADFYGLGHSEELIGKVFGNSDKVIVATKVGHRLAEDESILLDYSKDYIISACEQSLRRFNRDAIDYYQLHSAKLQHLENGECIEAMEQLREQGKIKYWGLSLNTFNPYPEAEYMMNHKLGNGFQLVLNIINQRSNELVDACSDNGYGVIARMPIQFGLLTGKFDKSTRFNRNDHRFFRLPPEILSKSLDELELLNPFIEKYGISKTSFALSFILTYKNISTVIPGIRTPEQAESNTSDLTVLSDDDFLKIQNLYESNYKTLLDLMEKQG